MPIWLRRFTFRKMKEFYDKENEPTSTSSTRQQNLPIGPDIDPSYTARVSSK